MKALAVAYALAASLALPALLWAADDPPAGPATTTTQAAPPADEAPAQTTPAPAPEPAAPQPAADPAPAPASASAPPASAPAQLVVVPRAAPTARAAGASAVTIKDFVFAPASATVNVGDTVTWTNQDSAEHTATASDGSFDTGNLKKGSSGSHKFTKAGSFSYICSIHPNMKGTVVVKAASSGTGDGAGSEGTGSGSGSSGDSSSSDSSSSSDPFNSSGSDTSSSSSSSDSSLPSTGGDAPTTVLVGLLLLGSGALLRRRFSRY